MHSDWAAEHLLVIRTLMERSAIYRRALAPIVLSLGFLGVGAALLGWLVHIQAPRSFVQFWSAVGVLGLLGAYALARRQALREAEPFWSAPTRRVTQALLPPLFAGFVASAVTIIFANRAPWMAWWIVPVWMVLYGCAVHAAGFFMPRGMKLFGWGFILVGCGAALRMMLNGGGVRWPLAHLLMGVSFGGLHLGYGIYLYFTERKKSGL